MLRRIWLYDYPLIARKDLLVNQGELIQDRYRLEHPLGRGGMAEVWCARDERLERTVALKLLAPQFADDPEFLVRFFSEAQSVARLNHPNVVAILDFGDHDGRPYLVMEYVPGGALGELTGTPLLPERAVEIVSDAAKGAGAAHRIGLIHRDIKPANILLCQDGLAKLADFGIAAATGSERLTATGQAIGSPHYVSPEQASGRPATPASDVYALGIVLYELLTGRKPFDADNVTAIAIAHVEQQPVPPSDHVPDLEPALEAVVLKCLDKDPERRFADGNALAVALSNPAVAMAPAIQTADDAPWEVVGSPGALRRLMGVAALMALVILVIGGLVWAATREDDPLDNPASRDYEVTDRGVRERKPEPKKRPGADETPAAAFSASSSTPAPSPSATPRPTPTRAPAKPAPEPEPEPEPEPTPTAEPSPAPTAEPTPEPTPTGEVQDVAEEEQVAT